MDEPAGDSNLRHAIESAQAYPEFGCTDPDCEIHNIDVACEEGVISKTALAYWLAGAMWMAWKFDAFHPAVNPRNACQHVHDSVAKFPQPIKPESLDAAQHFEQEDR